MANKIQTSCVFLLALIFLLGSASAASYRKDESCIRECGLVKPSPSKALRFGCDDTSFFNSRSFDKDFLFGAATSAYQIEGAAGRSLNIWDSFTHYFPDKAGGATGDLATDSYHLLKEDVELMLQMGIRAYRFSIAWSRVLPKGRGKPNPDGIAYYHKLLNMLVQNNIKPFVTLFHWDVPQTLQDEYEGFLSPLIVNDFKNYADLCFREFGSKVKHWITLNQPYTVSYKGHGLGDHAPGRCSNWQNSSCTAGDSGTEPYHVAHNQLLAHAAAVHLYRNKYQPKQKGLIGTTLIDRWFTPRNPLDEKDVEATERAKEFFFGWFMEPLVRGDYPAVMKELVGERLPKFTKKESDFVKGTLDFLGVNYYLAQYVQDVPTPPDPNRPSVITDPRVNLTFYGVPVPGDEKSLEFHYFPLGLRDILEEIRDKYNNPRIFITENGMDSNGTASIPEILNDHKRINYHCSHLCFLRCAILEGSRVEGYFAWSLMDNYEFGQGYKMRFGMNYVDFANPTDRRNKKSAIWYRDFIDPLWRSPLGGENDEMVQEI